MSEPMQRKSAVRHGSDVRKSRKKFIRFIERHCEGFFDEALPAPNHTKIAKADLPKVLNAIYTARSKYLHAGEPMFSVWSYVAIIPRTLTQVSR